MKGISECPKCGDNSVWIPVDDWTSEYNKRTGEVTMTAHYNYEKAECTNLCDLTNVEPTQYHVVGFTEDGGY